MLYDSDRMRRIRRLTARSCRSRSVLCCQKPRDFVLAHAQSQWPLRKADVVVRNELLGGLCETSEECGNQEVDRIYLVDLEYPFEKFDGC